MKYRVEKLCLAKTRPTICRLGIGAQEQCCAVCEERIPCEQMNAELGSPLPCAPEFDDGCEFIKLKRRRISNENN